MGAENLNQFCRGPAVMLDHDLDFRTDEQKDVDDENDLKVEINTFVWTHAPAEMPLGLADELACKIFELMREARENFNKRPTEQ